jgi:Uma2 family endonuclease
MQTGALISTAEYLRTAYQPDCDFIDGAVIDRNVGEYPHSRLQGLLYAYLLRRRKQWNITPILEQRIQISANKFLIPDICVLKGPEPTVRVLTEAPSLWIEILSSEDRPVRVNRKVKDVLDFGVPYVWVVDPETLESYLATSQSQNNLADGVLQIDSLGITIPLNAVDED